VRKAVMILLALAAIRLLPKALRREARALELLTVLFEITLAAAANTSKAVSTEQRTAALEVKTGAITTQLAGNSGFANALGYGPTSTANVGVTSGPDGADTGNYSFSTGPQIGGAAAHVHNGVLPNLPNAIHTHDFGGHTHDFGGHAHPL
jgi:hypothetical protein